MQQIYYKELPHPLPKTVLYNYVLQIYYKDLPTHSPKQFGTTTCTVQLRAPNLLQRSPPPTPQNSSVQLRAPNLLQRYPPPTPQNSSAESTPVTEIGDCYCDHRSFTFSF